MAVGREGKFSSTLPGSVLLKREIKCTLLKRGKGGGEINPTLDYKVCVGGWGGGGVGVGAEEN